MIWPQTLDEVLDAIVKSEGGFANHPADSGGPTKYGITMRSLGDYRGHAVSVADVQNLSVDEAKAIYLERYIRGPGFFTITNARILYIVCDTSILFGPERATRFLQGSLGEKVDGVMGPLTASSANGALDPRAVTNAIAVCRINYHVQRCDSDPTQLQFLKGWVNRSVQFIE